MASPVKACVAEAIGTFALCFIGGGAICMTTLQGSAGAGLLGVAMAHGLILSIAVSATMNVSGGHLNPAVTIVMLVTKRIGGADGVKYIVSQLVGGTITRLRNFISPTSKRSRFSDWESDRTQVLSSGS